MIRGSIRGRIASVRRAPSGVARLAIAIALVASGAVAQAHTDGWIVAGRPLSPPGPSVVHISPTGTPTTLLAEGVFGGDVIGATLDADNSGLVVTWSPPALIGASGVARITRAGAVLTTLLDSTTVPLRFTDVTIGPDGDYWATAAPAITGVGSIYGISRTGVMRTIASGTPLDWPVALTVDVARGRVIVLDSAPGASRVLAVTPSGTVVSIVATLPTPGLGQIAYDFATDGYWIGTAAPNPLLHVTPNGVVTTPTSPGTFDVIGVAVDRASAVTPTVWLGTGPLASRLLAFDPATGATTTLRKSSQFAHDQVIPDHARNLVATQVAPRQWRLDLAIPSDAGVRYAMFPSISGIRPGVPLPDGRRIAINPDAISTLALAGLLAPRWTGGAGQLSATGRATAMLDLRGLSVAGLKVWVIAATLGAQAPLGLQTIADPVVLTN